MSKTQVIRISSQKGGVGKTSVAVNLSVALAAMGKKVLLVDGDPINSNVVDFLGMEEPEIGFKEILFGKLDASLGIVPYKEGKMDVLPGTDYIGDYDPTPGQIVHLGLQVSSFQYEFVIVDTPPGFFVPDLTPMYTEAIIVSTPQEPSVLSNKRLTELYNQNSLKSGIVLNRIGGNLYELSPSIIRSKYGLRVSAKLPEDTIVPESISKKKPAYLLDKTANFCLGIENLAKKIL